MTSFRHPQLHIFRFYLHFNTQEPLPLHSLQISFFKWKETSLNSCNNSSEPASWYVPHILYCFVSFLWTGSSWFPFVTHTVPSTVPCIWWWFDKCILHWMKKKTVSVLQALRNSKIRRFVMSRTYNKSCLCLLSAYLHFSFSSKLIALGLLLSPCQLLSSLFLQRRGWLLYLPVFLPLTQISIPSLKHIFGFCDGIPYYFFFPWYTLLSFLLFHWLLFLSSFLLWLLRLTSKCYSVSELNPVSSFFKKYIYDWVGS